MYGDGSGSEGRATGGWAGVTDARGGEGGQVGWGLTRPTLLRKALQGLGLAG